MEFAASTGVCVVSSGSGSSIGGGGGIDERSNEKRQAKGREGTKAADREIANPSSNMVLRTLRTPREIDSHPLAERQPIVGDVHADEDPRGRLCGQRHATRVDTSDVVLHLFRERKKPRNEREKMSKRLVLGRSSVCARPLERGMESENGPRVVGCCC